jgi:cell division protein FtsN
VPGEVAAWTPAKKGLVVAASLAVATLAVWFGVRALNPASSSTAPAPSPPAPSPASRPAERSTPPPSGASATTPPAPPSGAPAAPRADAGGSPPEAAAITGERFEIVLASFRTESRAASVAASVEALGLPMRRRTADGWQQVLAGPFASRAEADAAQLRLERAGLGGGQIVPAGR